MAHLFSAVSTRRAPFVQENAVKMETLARRAAEPRYRGAIKQLLRVSTPPIWRVLVYIHKIKITSHYFSLFFLMILYLGHERFWSTSIEMITIILISPLIYSHHIQTNYVIQVWSILELSPWSVPLMIAVFCSSILRHNDALCIFEISI